MICEHNEKLASHDRKKIKNFVMLIFFIFGRGFFRGFFYNPLYKENGYKLYK
jgi:hypothetical protein